MLVEKQTYNESIEIAYNFYFASPFFNEEQVEREEALKKILRDRGNVVFSPKENLFLRRDATFEERQKCFDENCRAILSSAAVFAVTDGKDVGTIWEAGFAYALGIPVVYFCETLPPDGQFNLMLAQSGTAIYTSREQLISADYIPEPNEYRGLIE